MQTTVPPCGGGRTSLDFPLPFYPLSTCYTTLLIIETLSLKIGINFIKTLLRFQ